MSRKMEVQDQLTREQSVMLAIDSLRGESIFHAAKKRGIWARSAKLFVSAYKRGHFPDVMTEARQRLGIVQDGEPWARVVIDMGRVKRDGALGEPLTVEPARFWAMVDRSAGPDACWPFMGSRDSDGYGRHRSFTAMRIAWALVHGSIPPRMVICHQCDNPPCCNLAHLFLGTIQDNIDDAEIKRHARRRAENSADYETVTGGHAPTPAPPP